MFVPLHDDTPLRLIRFQWVVGAIIVINVLVFLATGATTSEVQLAAISTGFGVVPDQLFGSAWAAPGIPRIPEFLTLFTYQFLHGGWMHLIGNMLFLWVFADNIEDAFGHWQFLAFYLLTGAAAALLHSIVESHSQVPLIGASGSVSGVLAAYLLLYPRARVWILLFLRIPLRIPAWIALIGWFVFQVVSLAIASRGDADVAFWAHVGGFLTGLILTLAIRSPFLHRPARQLRR